MINKVTMSRILMFSQVTSHMARLGYITILETDMGQNQVIVIIMSFVCGVGFVT